MRIEKKEACDVAVIPLKYCRCVCVVIKKYALVLM